MKRVRGWSKTTWAAVISAVVWTPVLLLAAIRASRPPEPGTDLMSNFGPEVAELAVVGFILSFVILRMALAVVSWVMRRS